MARINSIQSNPPKIEYIQVDDLWLDPRNPRLGRHNTEKRLDQDTILDLMKDWALDELAVSFIESGFWPQEAVIVVKEQHQGREVDFVVEGNRRLAALKLLHRAWANEDVPAKWRDIATTALASRRSELKMIAVIRMPNRAAVKAYLGFRHVTGIAEWNPAEKAEFIASLIDDDKLSYDDVRKRIGSKTPSVRQNYIAYRILIQMQESEENIDLKRVEKRFSVLYLSLRTNGVQKYLQIDVQASPNKAMRPVPKKHLKNLRNFALWLFGEDDLDPIVADSRQVDEFGRILESEAAVDYLERTERPSFEVARRMAGVAESELALHLERAADELQEALKAVHHHKKSKRIQAAAKRVGLDTLQLLGIFPEIKREVFGGDE